MLFHIRGDGDPGGVSLVGFALTRPHCFVLLALFGAGCLSRTNLMTVIFPTQKNPKPQSNRRSSRLSNLEDIRAAVNDDATYGFNVDEAQRSCESIFVPAARVERLRWLGLPRGSKNLLGLVRNPPVFASAVAEVGLAVHASAASC